MAVPGGASLDHACQRKAPLYGPCQWRSRAEPRWTMLDSWGPYWYLTVRSAVCAEVGPETPERQRKNRSEAPTIILIDSIKCFRRECAGRSR